MKLPASILLIFFADFSVTLFRLSSLQQAAGSLGELDRFLPPFALEKTADADVGRQRVLNIKANATKI